MKTNKQIYIEFFESHQQQKYFPVFSHPVWLDAVAENWDVCLCFDNTNQANVIACLPYCWKGNRITKRIYLPDLSFYQSVLFLNDDITTENKIQLTLSLFEQLPVTIQSYFKFLPQYHFLDLSKLHYKKECYTTYLLQNESDVLSIRSNHKRNIQKAIKSGYVIKESIDISKSFEILAGTFVRQKLKSKIKLSDFASINTIVNNHRLGKTFDCLDVNNHVLASIFILEDHLTVYYLLGGYDSTHKNTGAMTYLLYYTIEYALKKQKSFNFCGSTRASIAHYFEGFGAKPSTLNIWKKSII